MKIARLLKKAGWRVGARLIQRLRQQLGLMVPVKKPKRRLWVAKTHNAIKSVRGP